MVKGNAIELFLDDLASRKPTPSGGGAAAVIGAMGAALVSMAEWPRMPGCGALP